MWKKKLKQKRHQFLLIGIILLFTTAIFAGCISFTLETTLFGKTFFTSDKCPDMVYLAKDTDRDSYIKDSPNLMKDINDLSVFPAKYITASTYINEKSINLAFNSCIALNSINEIHYYFKLVKSSTSTSAPGDNEVWLSKAFADEQSIKLGDTVSFRSTYRKDLTVTGLYNTSTVPSNMMGIFPMYVSRDTLDELIEPDATYITMDTKHTIANDRIPSELTDHLYYSIDGGGINMTYSTASTIFGGVGTLASLVIFIVAIVIIRYILRSTIIREYRSIGIYKSLGFTYKEIKRFYLNCYTLIGVIAIPIGILLGLPLAALLGSITNQYVGGYHITGISVITGLLSFLVLMILLLANVLAALRKLKTITPVKALTMGTTSTKKKMKHSVIKNASSPFAMAINQIFKKKSMSIMVILVLSVSFYLCLFFSSINYVCTHIDQKLDIWFARPKVSCSVSTQVNDDLLEYLTNNSNVESFVYGDYSIRINDLYSYKTKKDISNNPILTYNTYDPSCVQFTYIDGRPPENLMEIAITTDAVEEIGGNIGDYVALKVNGQTYDFLITGTFSSLLQGGHNIHVSPSTLDKCKVPYTYDNIEILLKDNVTVDQFQEELTINYPNLQVEKIMSGLQSAIDSVENLSKPIMNTLVVVFALFSILNIINLMIMNNIENRKQYGILKSLGFTNRYICAQNLYKNLILSTVASIIAQLLDLLLSKRLFFMIIKINAFTTPTYIRIGITLGMWLLILGITYLFTLPLRKIAPTELMEE